MPTAGIRFTAAAILPPTLSHGERYFSWFSATKNGDFQLFADAFGIERSLQFARIRDGSAVHREQDVANKQTCFFRRTSGRHHQQQKPSILLNSSRTLHGFAYLYRLNAYSDVAARDVSLLEQLRHYAIDSRSWESSTRRGADPRY